MFKEIDDEDELKRRQDTLLDREDELELLEDSNSLHFFPGLTQQGLLTFRGLGTFDEELELEEDELHEAVLLLHELFK